MLLRLSPLLMVPTIVLAFLWAPPARTLGEASRILYFHVPLAWISVLAFCVSGIASITLLAGPKEREQRLDTIAHNSAIIGIVFNLLAVIAGAFWAKISWGMYWNWDPRQITIVFLFSIYAAYLCLRIGTHASNAGVKINAVYLILAMIVLPFLVFVLPRMYDSLHPDPLINRAGKIEMDARMLTTLVLSLVSHSMVYAYILSMMNRIVRIETNRRADSL